ncbi:MAG: T9SS type A sorting domain-containing protein, partial [candidate division WOR-3 bacterium]|nr:T9SS type A sorting domain-containing protein [candidate division WOR-3 bacterium]
SFSLPVEIYLEDFEVWNGNFEPMPTSGGWAWGVPTSGPGSAHSGSKLWATVLNGNYTNNANWTLTSPTLTATTGSPELRFWHWYQFEGTTTLYDGGNVKISTDGGVTWTVVTPVGGYTGTASSSAAGVGGQPVYGGSSNGWVEAVFVLPVNAGQQFKLRWHFGSDGSVVYAGWYIDDVTGIGFAAIPPANNDVGVDAILVPGVVQRVGVTVNPVVRVKNYGLASQSNFGVVCSIFGAGHVLRYSDVQTVGAIGAGDTVRVTFSGWTPSVLEVCTVKVKTVLSGDQNPLNDEKVRQTVVSMMFISEGFNDAAFPPQGWQAVILSGTYNWERFTQGQYPTCTPYEGTAMAGYRSWNASSGSGARLISPQIVLTGASLCSLKFWMMHDPGYSTVQESVIVEVSTNGTTFNRVAAFRRYYQTQGWQEHSVYLGVFSSPFYVAFRALSGYGNNMYIDYVQVYGANPQGAWEDVGGDVIRTGVYSVGPNPVRGSVVIRYGLSKEDEVRLRIYDASGRIVKTLVNERKGAGVYDVTWNGKDETGQKVPQGIYFYTFETSNHKSTKKLLFIR